MLERTITCTSKQSFTTLLELHAGRLKAIAPESVGQLDQYQRDSQLATQLQAELTQLRQARHQARSLDQSAYDLNPLPGVIVTQDAACCADHRGSASLRSEGQSFEFQDGSLEVTGHLESGKEYWTCRTSAYGAYGEKLTRDAGLVLDPARGAARYTQNSAYTPPTPPPPPECHCGPDDYCPND